MRSQDCSLKFEADDESPWDFGRHIELFGDALDFLTRDEPFYDNPFTDMIPPAKRGRRSPSLPVSKSTMIHDLPDNMLVEILCRLGHNKVICQCKLVSKLWRTVLSDPYLLSRFLQQKPLIDNYGYVMVFFYKLSTQSSKLISHNIPFTPFLLNFQDGELQVVAIYNDLVLCSLKLAESDYYICNPQTKDWVRLPPTPLLRKFDRAVSVGFICDKPYYNLKDIDSPSSIIKLNQEYRFRVVRLIPKKSDGQHNKMEYYVEIFSSETGEWREYPLLVVLRSQQSSYDISFHAIACHGKLYWRTLRGCFVFGFNPFNITSTATSLDLIDVIDPPPLEANYTGCSTLRIGMSEGHLRMFKLFIDGRYVIWELKPQNQVLDGKPEWCLIKQSSAQITFIKMLEIYKFVRIVGLHPFDGDIRPLIALYPPQHHIQFFMWNVRDKTFEKVADFPFDLNGFVMESSPYVIPLLPTPITYKL